MKIVTETKAAVTLETGVAFGASSLAICEAKRNFEATDKIHYGVDPNQSKEYGYSALVSLEKEKLDSQFRLLEGPSHLMLPRLIEDGVRLDFAFVDGWHTFDYTLIDFFLIDKMLKPGGIVAFHDMHSLSKQKVLRYILTHRKYAVLKSAKVKGNESRVKTLKFFLWRLKNRPRLLFSWFHWNYQLFNSSGLVVLKKVEGFEPDYTFYKPF
jgi:predicted O-methyltransferase YrrM